MWVWEILLNKTPTSFQLKFRRSKLKNRERIKRKIMEVAVDVLREVEKFDEVKRS